MSQQEIEVILSRHLAECLAMPIFIVNPDGDLIFYNEPAEAILGQSYTETGMMPAKEWATVFQPFDSEGNPLPPDETYPRSSGKFQSLVRVEPTKVSDPANLLHPQQNFSVTPQLFKVVILAHIRREQVHDHITIVEDKPAFLCLTFHATFFLVILFRRFQDTLG